MPPKLVSDNGEFMVIRPLAYCSEKDMERWADVQQFPIIPCNLCGSQENLQRQVVKEMLNDWDKRFPGRIKNMFAALGRVTPSHLMDHQLFDFKNLKTTGVPDAEGDVVFDQEVPVAPGVIPLHSLDD
jgi:tRNA 2-thiocytidine biosynthesis protein TtcA